MRNADPLPQTPADLPAPGEGEVMETSREFILRAADMDRISVRCKSCTAELLLPMWKLELGETSDRDIKKQDLPATCPSCGDDWTQLYGAVKDFRAALVRVKEYSVSFRVPAPEEKRGD